MQTISGRAPAALALLAMFGTACGPSVVPYVRAGAPAPVHFTDNDDGGAYSVTVVDANGATLPACKLPCDQQVATGTATVIFSSPEDRAVSGRAVIPEGKSSVSFHKKRKGMVIAGAIAAATGELLAIPMEVEGDGGGNVDGTSLGLGVVGLGAMVVGLVLMLASGHDSVDVDQ